MCAEGEITAGVDYVIASLTSEWFQFRISLWCGQDCTNYINHNAGHNACHYGGERDERMKERALIF